MTLSKGLCDFVMKAVANKGYLRLHCSENYVNVLSKIAFGQFSLSETHQLLWHESCQL